MEREQRIRTVRVGNLWIGGDNPVVLQSMAATKTTDVAATAAMVERLAAHGAGIVRVAVDTEADVRALGAIRKLTGANLSVDLQENFRLAEQVAPFVEKIRYNPGHLHHRERDLPWTEKVRYLAQIAADHDVALRIGVNCGSLAPGVRERINRGEESCDGLLQSAMEQADFLESLGFFRFVVSIKDSDPATVVRVNRRFRALRPEIPLHLGVTEAGLPPVGVLKSRLGMEPLLAARIGETLRVSLTVENDRKIEEIDAGREILAHVAAGTTLDPAKTTLPKLNVISCPSCSRVENDGFVALARRVAAATAFASDYPLRIAVMGCRVNGPGETDDADYGLWCGAKEVYLKVRGKEVGRGSPTEIVDTLVKILHNDILQGGDSP